MRKKKILFIGGSLNQTTMMHQISMHLSDFDCRFTPLYCSGILKVLTKAGMLGFTPLGGPSKKNTELYLKEQGVVMDYEGAEQDYDLAVTCSDLIIQKNIRRKPVILVQEGMTDPENIMYYLVKKLKLPRYLASTSTTGLSHAYDKFCVASEGYKELFIRKGVRPEKIAVTGIPNFDNLPKYLINHFPYKNFVLAATSDARETLKFDNRKQFILDALRIADGRLLIFKLHPNEKVSRAVREISKYAPHALVFTHGNTHEMIANCDTLITQYSTVVYTGIVLGKIVHSYFDLALLRKLAPIQNGGASAQNIAELCREYLSSSNRRSRVFILDRATSNKVKMKELISKISRRLTS
jgi:hypothetical protein